MLSIKNCLDHKKWSLITCGWRGGAEKWVPVSTVNKEIRAKRVKWVNFIFYFNLPQSRSSELSPQSLSWSQTQDPGMHC